MIICFLGDSLTLGDGDATGAGWPGRVTGALMAAGLDVTAYNLGVRADTTTRIRDRWRQEAERRTLPGMDLRLVFSFGVADVANNVPVKDSLANAEAILSATRTMAPALMIGPMPVMDEAKRARVKALADGYAGVCAGLGLPYVPVLDSLWESKAYRQALNDFDTVHPAADGYAVLAGMLMQTSTVRTFFGLEH